MFAVMVLAPSRRDDGILGWFPATMTTAMVSPMLLPIPSTTEDMIPEDAAGIITLSTALSFESPRARAPSRRAGSKALRELWDTVTMVGRIITERRIDAVRMLFPLPVTYLIIGTSTIRPKKP